ncbi:monovalent cation/H+ antiporter subunit A [Devosia geojensis]|uniref:Monovalent cation/H+ antiporter subunit A n=1 Tax=Devosia geojensis TaxID=443610 RepID=A0A0F5FRZ4_9HYPH|nr:putative monovalent cation/H+ antiporter subunit A [Devosia geojensis]KKB11639.1 monovalent cation/H+ antiporter subunit A [Devosia geojensis]
MGYSPETSIILVAIAPFLAAILAPATARFTGAHAGWVLAIVPAAIFVFLLRFLEPVAGGEIVTASLEWAPAYGIALSFLIDGLSLTFALTISGIGALIIIYSGSYLAGHPHQGRFLGFMLAFMGAMLGLVLSDSMVALFTFWELTSVTSFLLIGFDHARQAARRAAIQALVVTNLGGLALLLGALVVQQITGRWELSGVRETGDLLRESPFYGLALVLFLLAAFTKSAQFPLHFWLPNAMEAPTPVSAFLHSATMVQAGVYLLARMTPVLGDTPAWMTILTLFGGVTLLWGAVAAIKQIDLKQMLAQTTIASLGLLVLLIGLGSEAAIAAMIVYFVAHAFYKAGLFLTVGVIDHETGTRDITALGGLMRKMPASFIAAALAAVSMIGLPLTVGYLAKEEMYLALAEADAASLLVLAVLIAGNALLAGVGIAVAARPFTGPTVETPKPAHEGPLALVAGPLVLAVLGIAAALAVGWFGHAILEPAGTAILGLPVESHLTLALNPASVLFWLSVLTWALGVLVFYQLDALRAFLRRLETGFGWTFDKGFDAAMFGLIRLSGAATRFLHHGRLELYLVVFFALFAIALIVPLVSLGGLETLAPAVSLGQWAATGWSWSDLAIYEWAVVALAIIGLVVLVAAQNRLVAIVSLGVQGIAVALLFLLFGAPDLAFTQFMVEILSVVILTLVMTRLKLDERDRRPFEDAMRDGTVAVLCGAGVTLLLSTILTGTLDTRLSDFFLATSVPIAHGHNIVNVILVDYRGFDTLGEISVVMAAGIAILALIRGQRGGRAARQVEPKPAGEEAR